MQSMAVTETTNELVGCVGVASYSAIALVSTCLALSLRTRKWTLRDQQAGLKFAIYSALCGLCELPRYAMLVHVGEYSSRTGYSFHLCKFNDFSDCAAPWTVRCTPLHRLSSLETIDIIDQDGNFFFYLALSTIVLSLRRSYGQSAIWYSLYDGKPQCVVHRIIFVSRFLYLVVTCVAVYLCETADSLDDFFSLPVYCYYILLGVVFNLQNAVFIFYHGEWRRCPFF